MKKGYIVDQISNTVNLDSLPYFDRELEEPGMQDRVDRMIAEEMKTFKPHDYLADYNIPDFNFGDDIILQNEYKRYQNKEPMERLDFSGNKISVPDNENADPEEWKDTFDKIQIQYEHQRTKRMNLELLQQFGKNVHRRCIDELHSMTDLYKEKNAKVLDEIEQVNRKRKSEQEQKGEKLRKLENEYNELLAKNYEIESSCQYIEGENRKRLEEEQEMH